METYRQAVITEDKKNKVPCVWQDADTVVLIKLPYCLK